MSVSDKKKNKTGIEVHKPLFYEDDEKENVENKSKTEEKEDLTIKLLREEQEKILSSNSTPFPNDPSFTVNNGVQQPMYNQQGNPNMFGGVNNNPYQGQPQGQAQPFYQTPPQKTIVYKGKEMLESEYKRDILGGGLTTFNWIDLSNLNPYQVNTTIASHELSLIEKAIKEVLDEHICRDLDVGVLLIDKTSRANLGVSVIIITVSPKNSGKINLIDKNDPRSVIPNGSIIAYHGLLIEGSIENLPPRYYYRQGYQQPVEVLSLTSDLNDDLLNSIIFKEVETAKPDITYYEAASNTVIPRNFDMTVRENVYKVMVNALMACQAAIAPRVEGFIDINLVNARRESGYLTQYVRFNKNNQEEDIFGNPVRADISLTTIAHGGNNTPYGVRGEQKAITHVTGYIELAYNDIHNIFGTQGYYQVPQQYGFSNNFPTQHVYTPVFVITQLFNSKIQTTAGLLLALINAASICDNNMWMQALLPDHTNGREDLNDIGNIGLDISLKNDGTFEKLKTTPDVFGPQQLTLLANQYFHPGLSFAIDVPECGQTSWMFKLLRGVARAKTRNDKFIEELVVAADKLTNGKFREKYELASGGLIKDGLDFHVKGGMESRITLGHYLNVDGVKRDKRDFGYLAVAGLAGQKGNRDEIISYTDSFNNARPHNLAEQLEMRRSIETSYLPNLTYTGYAERLVIDGRFIRALLEAAKENNYLVQTTENYSFLNQVGGRNYMLVNGTSFLPTEGTLGIFTNSLPMGYNNQHNPTYGYYQQPQQGYQVQQGGYFTTGTPSYMGGQPLTPEQQYYYQPQQVPMGGNMQTNVY